MTYAAPSTPFPSIADGFATGLAGTIGVRIRDTGGNDVLARTTAGIVEDIAGSGIYRVTLTAPAIAGQYTVVWDDGSIFAADDLIVTYTPLAAGPTDTFASVDELAVRLGVTFTADERVRAQTLLEMVTGLIQEETNQTIFLVTGDTLTTRSVASDRFRLPQRPVVSVASVALDGGTVDAGSWYLETDEIVQLNYLGISEQHFGGLGRGWLGPAHILTVLYTHGYATVPGVVKAICLDVAVRVWVNPGNVIQEKYGNESITYAPFTGDTPPVGMMLTDREKTRLTNTVGRPAGTISLR